MPGNPNECLKHAANCKRLAEQATEPAVREHFVGLAAQWERLASELESTSFLLDVLSEIELADPSASVSPEKR